ncbi:hypothetical protein BC833DRAFT_399805 [Globomyces pollinis-pini]|nr:hypothetical protein BC833DRAFT_399805 [Globomyces pollinis-pini]
MARRAKHEAELSKIKKEIRDAESNHQEQILEMEKSLLDTRIRLQKESDEKIRIMEAAAEEKAAKYLADHSSTLEKENRLLEIELEKMSIKVKRLLERKDQLTNENSELEREQRLKQDLVTIRLKNISNAEEKERRERYKRSCRIAEERQRKMSDLIERKGLGLATKSKMNHVDFKTADAHGWIDLESEDDD